uniref:Uncharacterized protein n=1 Tax=Glossina austeni TaxID=7395 RepID=A0A1A9VML2_GLOAU
MLEISIQSCTKVECIASEVLLELESTARSRHLNPFNPLHHHHRHHHHHHHHHHQPNLTHLSSNGYYGFSYINAMHEMEMNNNNNNDNNNVDENHNNNSVTQDFMGNDDVNNDNINNNRRVNTVELRCKKRCLISINNSENDCSNETQNHYQSSAKRCRYDNDDFTAAQQCNDFFSLPFTQIVTQSCYMDTDESSPTIYAHQQLQQLRSPTNDETMLNDNNNSDIVEKNESQKIQSPHVSNHTHLDEIDQQHPHHDVNHRPQSNQTPQQQLQQHYQGHLHRANRDVNRCMVSHMI